MMTATTTTVTAATRVLVRRTGTAQAFTCRADRLADELGNSGWVDAADDQIRGQLDALQRVLTGPETYQSDALQEALGLTVEPAPCGRTDGVAAPPDATRVGAWDDVDDPAARRYFTGSVRVAGPATVGTQGWQARDGAVTSRSIYVDLARSPHDELDAATARQIAAALTAAARELEALTAGDREPMVTP